MKKFFILISILPILLFCKTLSAKPTGLLFNVQSSGSALTISTVPTNHNYPAAGIQILTPGYSLASGCTPSTNGYCLFTTSNTTPATITINGPSGNINIILCLNGVGPLSCQHYNNIAISSGPTMPEALYVIDNTTSFTNDVGPADLCSLDFISGAILSCTGTGGGLIPSPKGIAINSAGTMAYITASNTQNTHQCPIAADGTFTTCTATAITAPADFFFSRGTVALNSALPIAYFNGFDVNKSVPLVIACNINNDGSIDGNCSNVAAGNIENTQVGIAVSADNSTAYLTSEGSTNSAITVCSITVDGLLFTPCQAKTGDKILTFPTSLAGVALNAAGTLVYIVNNVDNLIYACSTINTGTQFFDSCFVAASATNGIANPWMIALNQANTVAYVSENNGTNVYTCPILPDNTFGNCTATGGFISTYGLALK